MHSCTYVISSQLSNLCSQATHYISFILTPVDTYMPYGQIGQKPFSTPHILGQYGSACSESIFLIHFVYRFRRTMRNLALFGLLILSKPIFGQKSSCWKLGFTPKPTDSNLVKFDPPIDKDVKPGEKFDGASF